MDPTSDALGAALALGAGALAIVLGSVLRTRLPGAILAALLAACGAAVGAGALLLQADEVNTTNQVVTILAMAVLGPFQVRVVFGPLGRSRRQPRGGT